MSLKNIIARNFNNPQMLALISILVVVSLVIYFFGSILAPVFLAIGLAYLLNFPIQSLIRRGVSRGIALFIVYTVLICVVGFLVAVVVPLLIRQVNNLVTELPNIFEHIKVEYFALQKYFAPHISTQTFTAIYESFNELILQYQDIRIDRIASVVSNLFYIAANIFLVPFMSLLLLVDYAELKKTVVRYLPERSELAKGVFVEFLGQLDNYVKGKVIEFLIMTLLSYLCFFPFGLKYNLVLSIIIGISVIIPYVGVVIATVPLFAVAFVQYGLDSYFYGIVVVHLILQVFNGNILVPYLYSKANNLRPFTIIVAVLFFGQVWGFIGVFLAIPLATLFKAVANAWYMNSQLYKDLHEREREDQYIESE